MVEKKGRHDYTSYTFGDARRKEKSKPERGPDLREEKAPINTRETNRKRKNSHTHTNTRVGRLHGISYAFGALINARPSSSFHRPPLPVRCLPMRLKKSMTRFDEPELPLFPPSPSYASWNFLLFCNTPLRCWLSSPPMPCG